jgi:hypothetical protein
VSVSVPVKILWKLQQEKWSLGRALSSICLVLCSVLSCDEAIPQELDETTTIVITEPPTGCDGECAMKFDKCGGARVSVSKHCCEEGTACIVKDMFFAQCLTAEDAEANVKLGWNGRCAISKCYDDLCNM